MATVPAVRALIATAGLLLLAGTAAAASTQPSTLRHSPAPVDAVAQDGGLVAWLSGNGNKCNVVHVLAPDGTEVLPQPATQSMTCHWDLSAGQPQLALAAGSSSALWTLHESGSVPYDYVMAARVGGREVQVDRLAHESDGTGWWLGGIAGAGTTLAYSTVDVEYVDPLDCASGGSCKKKIAGGGIQLVSGGHATTLIADAPALDLAASNGRLAFLPATRVAKSGAPAPSRTAAIEIADATQGTLVSQAQPDGFPLALALAPRVLAVLTRTSRTTDKISWYDAEDGIRLGSVAVPGRTAPELAASDRVVVFRIGHTIRGVGLATGRIRTLARAANAAVGLSLSRGQLVWAENTTTDGRIQALALR